VNMMRRFVFMLFMSATVLLAAIPVCGPAWALMGDNYDRPVPPDGASEPGGMAQPGQAMAPVPPGRTLAEQPNQNGTTDYLARIDSMDDWYRVAAAPKSHVAARAEIVKFIWDLTSGQMYFTNARRWPIHYDFVSRFVAPDYPHELFNKREYRTDERRFVMGSLVHYRDAAVWALETLPGDNMSAQMLRDSFNRVVGSVFFGEELKFRPQSPLHEQRIGEIKSPFPVWPMDAYQASIRYQPLTLGKALGRVRIVRGDVDMQSVRPDEILVTDHVPEDLPPVAGLVTSQLQAPLAHVSILLENRKTPNMALKGAVDMDQWQALEGKIARLDVGAQDYTVKKASLYEAEMWWNQLRPEQTVTPVLDARDIGLPELCDVDRTMLGAVGGKAAHLGEVCGLPGVSVPGGFVVPVYQYRTHLQRAGIDRDIADFLPGGRAGDAVRLARIRADIQAIRVDKALIRDMRARIKRLGLARVILRSSTNVEDVQGFNGAGLYASKVIAADASDDALADALKHVWASAWNLRAFEERDWFRIEHEPVGMAVLVQPYIDGVAANGVAITANPFYIYRPGVLINVQTMDGSITAAHDGTLPESLLIYTYGVEPEIHVLSRSTLNGGRPIMPETTALDLLHVLRVIHAHFYPDDSYKSRRAMDVEFLLRKNGWPVILQARPYTVNYREEH